MAEAGVIVHCLDLPASEYITKLGGSMKYASVGVTNQEDIWEGVESIANREGRIDVAVASAGILHDTDYCLDYKDSGFQSGCNFEFSSLV
jgi:NAD(P)-dependent dehydrogenase (short-subunit alcohol dehydrogenase family)